MFRNFLSAAFACGLFTAVMLSIPATADAQNRSTNNAGGVGIGRGKDRPKTEAPEINVYGAPAALAIVLGGAAIVLGRHRRKSV
jgi:hypothetical protein